MQKKLFRCDSYFLGNRPHGECRMSITCVINNELGISFWENWLVALFFIVFLWQNT